MTHPTLSEEKKLWKRGFKRIACIDEAGIGPLAGPVTAAAVAVINQNFQIPISKLSKVNDSKKLSAKKREELYELITKNPNLAWGVGVVSEKVIDKVNVLEASKLAMKKALKKLNADFLILDGRINLKLPVKQKSIIKADAKVFSCSAASILAKVTRDRIMQKMHKKYPQYRFDVHKGYPTKQHCELLRKYGPSKIHRRSFAPVRACANK